MAPRNKRIVPLPELTADESAVREILEDLRVAYENVLNAYPDKHDGQTVRYIDAMMAVHNLHRVVISHVLEESGMPVVESLGFMRILRDTFTNAMDRDMAQLREKAEGMNRGRPK